MPDIVLEAGDGPMQLSSFDGKYVILVFGYTTCPDVCPITLAALQSAISELDPEVASRFQVVFVSVDYRRDSPMQVSRYARSFRPDFVGATGSEMEIAQVARDYGIYYKLNEPDPESGFYTVEHTASVLVLDPQRRLIMTWPYGLQAGELSRDLRLLAAS
jgi:protein SCO1/2